MCLCSVLQAPPLGSRRRCKGSSRAPLVGPLKGTAWQGLAAGGNRTPPPRAQSLNADLNNVCYKYPSTATAWPLLPTSISKAYSGSGEGHAVACRQVQRKPHAPGQAGCLLPARTSSAAAG